MLEAARRRAGHVEEVEGRDQRADATLDDVLGLVLSSSTTPLDWEPAPEPVAARMPARTVAVDGSSSVLVQNGNAWVVAVRAAAVTWPGPREEPPVAIHAAVPDDAGQTLEAAWARHGLEPGPEPRSVDAFAESWRALSEHEALRSAVASLSGDAPDPRSDGPPSADLLLVDGALRGLPRHEQTAMDRILDAADRKGILVAGVAKRSGLAEQGLPLVPRIEQAVSDPGPWAVRVPGRTDVWVARLHRVAGQAFRVDGPAGALPFLVGLSRDAAYPGYPYPLALAHNAVALTAGRMQRERARLESAVRRRGGAEAWAWLRDFHAVLDRNVPG